MIAPPLPAQDVVFKIFLKKNIYESTYLSVRVYTACAQCLQNPEEGTRFPRGEVADSCEVLMGAGNVTTVLCGYVKCC